jgi:ribosomal protein L40E
MFAEGSVVAMSVFDMTPFWMLVMTAVFLIIAATEARKRRLKDQRRFDVRVCGQCGASQPPHATFCRHCGKHL